MFFIHIDPDRCTGHHMFNDPISLHGKLAVVATGPTNKTHTFNLLDGKGFNFSPFPV